MVCPLLSIVSGVDKPATLPYGWRRPVASQLQRANRLLRFANFPFGQPQFTGFPAGFDQDRVLSDLDTANFELPARHGHVAFLANSEGAVVDDGEPLLAPDGNP